MAGTLIRLQASTSHMHLNFTMYGTNSFSTEQRDHHLGHLVPAETTANSNSHYSTTLSSEHSRRTQPDFFTLNIQGDIREEFK
jgi:hypothetical protein